MNFLYTNIPGFDSFYNQLPHLISKYDRFANIPHFNDKLPLLFRNKHLIFGIVFAIINVEVISMDGKTQAQRRQETASVHTVSCLLVFSSQPEHLRKITVLGV